MCVEYIVLTFRNITFANSINKKLLRNQRSLDNFIGTNQLKKFIIKPTIKYAELTAEKNHKTSTDEVKSQSYPFHRSIGI